MRVSLFEIFLIQIILYSVLWLVDEYIATFMCITIPIIVLVILAVSLMAEFFEPSRISRKYFWIMTISIVAPVLVGLVFYLMYDGKLEWLTLQVILCEKV
jgi:hypothetical protein